MKAFVLAAGLGTRLRPLTDFTPKCLLPLGNTSLLQIWLAHLQRYGVNEVLLNTHWLPEPVESFLASRGKALPRVQTVYEPKLLGSAGTLLANRTWVEDGEPFFIVYGDSLTEVDLGAMLACHQSHGLPFTLGVFRAEEPRRCGIATVDNDGLVTGFVEKPDQPVSNLAAAGVYVADARVFDYFPAPSSSDSENGLDLSYDVLPRLVGRMKCFDVGHVLDIGTPASYARGREMWTQKAAREDSV